jgi:HrpA-like RNA helicase
MLALKQVAVRQHLQDNEGGIRSLQELLPVFARKQEIVDTVNANSVTILYGELLSHVCDYAVISGDAD